MSNTSSSLVSPVKMVLLGRRARKMAKYSLVLFIIILTVLGSIGNWLPGLATTFASLFPSSYSSSQAQSCPTLSSATLDVGQCPSSIANSPGSNTPNFVGADPVPNLSLPRTALSSLSSLISQGGVVQDSYQNLTLYNLEISMRLLGGSNPHDQILGSDHRILSPLSFWTVQANDSGQMITLNPLTSDFTLLGTNSSGTSVARTMRVASGQYSGIFEIVYTVTPAGPLKWDLSFTPNVSGIYQITYSWHHSSQDSALRARAKSFVVSYSLENLTLDWGDIPASFPTTPTISHNEFSLAVSLGTVAAGHQIMIDPTIASNVGSGATAFTFQRKIVYNSQSGYYFAFYHNGQTAGFSSSPNGTTWSAQQSMAPGWPGYNSTDFELSVLSVGQTITVVAGESSLAGCLGNCIVGVHPHIVYASGTMSGGSITWQPTHYVGAANPTCSSNGSVFCYITAGYRYVSATFSSTGTFVFSYNYFEIHQNDTQFCASIKDLFEVSNLYMNYSGNILEPQAVNGCTGTGYTNPPFAATNNDRSILIPADTNGKIRIIYQYAGSNSAPTLYSTWYDGTTQGTTDTLQSTVPDNDQFSAVADANNGQHLVYTLTNGTVIYQYRGSIGSQWTGPASVFGGPVVANPSVSVDYSTNNIYVLGITPGAPGFYYVIMKSKSLNQNWSDQQASYPVTSRTSAAYLSSAAISASATNAAQIAAIWTNGTSPNFNVGFASIPIQTVWSPYATPPLPWDGNGLAPYGQYFSNLGEYVSPSTGMLTIRQTDLSVSGRGINLAIARVYTEPSSFAGGIPYLFDAYPWAPLGDGWQLNFPWMTTTAHPSFLHVSDGQGYIIPSSFWVGSTATFENHRGENFRLVRFVNGTIVLYDKTGTAYSFGTSPTVPNHALTTITDSTGNNTISFNYANNLISCISDTLQRAFSFSYSGGFLQRMSQVNGTCSNQGSVIRSITYGNNGASLTSVTDPANRATSFLPGANAWLISKITYPTGWYDNYTYTTSTLGTQAMTYRVSLQQVVASPTSTIRQFRYTYTQGVGDQITNSTVASYNATTIASYTKYSFSFLGDFKNVTDASGNLLSGDEQFFSVNGEIPRDVILVSDGHGHIGSYTNYYGYDLWGNQIYSRQAISSASAPSSHENFNSYYNDGEPPAFAAFQDSFSNNQGTAPDNSWNVTGGNWLVSNGIFNGTETVGEEATMFAWADIGRPDISIQTQLYVATLINNTGSRVGILTHFPKTGSYKWGLVFYNGGLYLLDEWNVWLAGVTCPLSTGSWYTLNMTVRGYSATGWASRPGQSCTVSGTFSASSPAAAGTAFGLYAGGYSALFDDVRVVTTVSGFTNSFLQNGAPGPIGLNTWLSTTKPPASGWNTNTNWLPAASWGQAYASQDYGKSPWNTTTGWPDSNSQWIWTTPAANVSASLNPVWLRRIFTVTATTSLNVSITCDDSFALYLDGSQLGTGNNWHQVYSFTAFAGPGMHVLAVNATNTAGPAGLLVSAKNAGTGQVIFRSDATAGPQIGALAGTAQLQNGIGSVPMETYYGYYPWGGLNQTRQLYESGQIGLILTSEKDTGGNFGTALTSNPISVVPNEGIVIVSQLSVICCSINDPPFPGPCDVVISDTLGITFTFETETWTAANGGVGQCLWAGIARSFATGTISQSGFGYSAMQIFGYSNVGGFGTAAGDSSWQEGGTFLYGWPFTVDLALTLQNSKSSIVGFTEAGRPCTTGATFSFTPQSTGLVQEQTESYAGSVGAFYCGTNQTVAYGGDGEDIVNPAGPNTVLHYKTTISSNVPNGYWTAVAVELIPITTPSSPQWITTSRTYDRFGNPVSTVDARGNYTYFNYSTLYQNAYLTNETQVLKPGNTKITRLYSYNLTMGSMLSTVDPNGFNTTYQYDVLGRATRVNNPNGLGFTAYTYNDQANYVDITNENGWHTRQVYDGLGRLAITEKFLGSTSYNETYRYNWQNKKTMYKDPLGNTYTYTYDLLGRLSNTTKPDQTEVRRFYNDTGSWVRIADENGNYQCSVLDRMNRLISIVENASSNCQAGIVSNYYYDEIGDLTQVINANQKSTTYAIDNLGRLTKVYFADATAQSYTYDNIGNVIKKVDQKQYSTLYSYDSMNRLSIVSYCGPPVTGTTISSASYTYDKDGNLVKLQNKNTTLTNTYDARSRTLSEKYAVNTNATTVNLGCVGTGLPTTSGSSLTYTISYRYNGEVMANMTYPDGLVVKYAYDGLGRVTTASKSGSSTNYATFTYYNCPCAERIKGIGFGDGTVANYTYDSLTRPSTIKVVSGNTLLLNLSYTYRNTGTVSSITGKLNGASINEQYTYDQLNRIVGSTLIDGGTTNTLSYKYDRVGNRLNQTLNGATTSYTINQANNELTGSSVTGTSIASSYDPNGNLATSNVTTRRTVNWKYAWSFSNQLVQVSSNGAVQGTYAYDGMERRVESIESSTTFYAYLGTETLYESVVSGAKTDYVYAASLRIAKVSGTTTSYYHPDALGSTRLVTTTGNKGVTVVFSDNYQPYGQDNGTPTGSETYKFTGKPYSTASNLYYYYSRWYNPTIGRFISQDPKGPKLTIPETFNQYIYVSDNPTINIDPTGEDWLSILSSVGTTLWNGLQAAGNTIVQGAQTAGDFLVNNVHLGGVGNSLSKNGNQVVDTAWHGLQTIGNIYWSNTVVTVNGIWNGLKTLGNIYTANTLAVLTLMYNAYVVAPIVGWNSPDRNVRTYYRCGVSAILIGLAVAGVADAPAAVDGAEWITAMEGVGDIADEIPWIASGGLIGGLFPVFGYYPGIPELIHMIGEVGPDAFIGCGEGIASYL